MSLSGMVEIPCSFDWTQDMLQARRRFVREGWTPVFTEVTIRPGSRLEFILKHAEGPE